MNVTWVLFLFAIFGFALWFCFRFNDIFCRHTADFIVQGVRVSEDDIIGLPEANIV